MSDFPPGSMPPPPPELPPPTSWEPSGQRPSVGTAISWAFGRFKAEFWPFVGLAAVVVVLWIVEQVSGFVDTGSGVAILLAVIFAVLGFIAQIGVQRAAIRSTQGIRPSMDAMITSQYLGRFILFTICSALVVVAGAIPGALIAFLLASSTAGLVIGILLAFAGIVVVYFLLQLGSYYVLDKGYGVGEAMQASYEAVSKNIGPAVLMTLFTGVVLFAASCCGLLTLLTLPFTCLFTAHMYRQFNQEPVH